MGVGCAAGAACFMIFLFYLPVLVLGVVVKHLSNLCFKVIYT